MPLIDYITKYIPDDVEQSLGFYGWPILICGVLTYVLISNNFCRDGPKSKLNTNVHSEIRNESEHSQQISRVITNEATVQPRTTTSSQRPIMSLLDSTSHARARSEVVSGNYDIPDRDDELNRSIEQSSGSRRSVSSHPPAPVPAPNTSAAVIAEQDQEFIEAQQADRARAVPSYSGPASEHWRSVQAAADTARERERAQAEADRAAKLRKRQAEEAALANRASVVADIREAMRASLLPDEGQHKICVRLPDGAKATRSFPADALVADVRAWAGSIDSESTVRWTGTGVSAEPVMDAFNLVRPGARGVVDDGVFVSDLGRMAVLFVEMHAEEASASAYTEKQ